jgi:hypothetical protein
MSGIAEDRSVMTRTLRRTDHRAHRTLSEGRLGFKLTKPSQYDGGQSKLTNRLSGQPLNHKPGITLTHGRQGKGRLGCFCNSRHRQFSSYETCAQ